MARGQGTTILRTVRTVALVGPSPNPERPSHRVARCLREPGLRGVPVNPTVRHVLGERTYPSLAQTPEAEDAGEVFRRSEEVPPLVAEAVRIGAKVVWRREGA